jgi:hypothetical protein
MGEQTPSTPRYISTFAEEAMLNFETYMRYYTELPGVIIHAGERTFGAFTGLNDIAYNAIMCSNMSHEDLLASIEEIQAISKNLAVPVGWWIWPTTYPKNTEQTLIEHGFKLLLESSPWMALKLVTLPVELPMPEHFSIELVHDDATLVEWLQTRHVANGGQRDELSGDYIEFHTRKRVWPGKQPVQRYLGRLHGEPVVTAELFISEGGAGLYSVGAVPHVEREVLEQTLVHYVLKQARGQGCQIAIVQATQDNYALYERLGFHEIGRTSLLVWQPPVSGSATKD